ncbi:hypothetical protein [Nonomuraea jabiensis]|uniref:Uncharacterized protein n=1 Tax=Nonomuraea jabiensis TaxID=882448 RepID=A0A7W9FZT2_9ACTN|nr:hypothetical protein [Nonomuraea jabiensis]MBB5774604.1 hypothetical protein [Nonomuraea jabiensis]
MSTALSGGVVGVGAAMSAAEAATQVGTATSVLAKGCGNWGGRRCGWGGWGGGRWANWRHRMPRIKIIIINTNRNRNVQQRVEERHEMDHHEDNNQPTWQ